MLLRVLLAATFFGISSLSHAATLSGTYVGTGSDVAILLQLVESTGGQLSGRYEQAKLVSGRKLERYSAIASGSVDRGTVVLQWRSTELLSGTFSASGSSDQNSLTLSGLSNGVSFTMYLARSTEDAFRSQVAALTGQVNQAEKARITADIVKRLTTVSVFMLAFNTKASKELENFLPLERQFQARTAAMSAAFARQQSVPKNDNTAVVRGQIDAAINQMEGASIQLHGGLQSSAQEFQSKLAALGKEINDLSEQCKIAKNETATQPDKNEVGDACVKVTPIIIEFGHQADRVLAGYQHAEAIWHEESDKQKSIVKSSDIASR